MVDRDQVRWNPREDGITHINMYSKGATELGRNLSHFSPIGFSHFQDGWFASLEAFWYWASTGKKYEHLKSLVGFKAKDEGKKLERIKYPGFMTDIEEAVRLKITQNERLLEEFKKSTLPFTHYYTYGTGYDKVALFQKTTPWCEYYYGRLRRILNNEISERRGLRVSITGSRTITDPAIVKSTIEDSGFNIKELVSGGAPGIDYLGEKYAEKRNIPFKLFPADWKSEPRRAGFIRNVEMADYVDAGIVLWDGKSPGTAHYLDYMKQKNKSLYLVRITPGQNNAG